MMHFYSLLLQSPPRIDPILYNSNHSILHFSTSLQQAPESINGSSKMAHFLLRVSHQPQKRISIISARRKNQRRRITWRKAVRKCVSFVAWNLRSGIAPNPLNLLLEDGGCGGGGFGSGRKKKGFGGGFEGRWELGNEGFLVLGWVLWLVFGEGDMDLGFKVLVSALPGCWMRVWCRRRRWGMENWCCVLGILRMMVGKWREDRLEGIVGGFRDRFLVLETALKRRRRRKRI